MSRLLEIFTAAGADVFVVRRFTGGEELGRRRKYHLELLSAHLYITQERCWAPMPRCSWR